MHQTEQVGLLKPEIHISRARSRSPSPSRGQDSPTPIRRDRSPSFRKDIDVGFAEAVSDVVETINFATSKRGRARG